MIAGNIFNQPTRGGFAMSTRYSVRRLVTAAGVLSLLLFSVSGAAWAANTQEILQAVKDGVPNTGDNRVVMAELFSRDG